MTKLKKRTLVSLITAAAVMTAALTLNSCRKNDREDNTPVATSDLAEEIGTYGDAVRESVVDSAPFVVETDKNGNKEVYIEIDEKEIITDENGDTYVIINDVEVKVEKKDDGKIAVTDNTIKNTVVAKNDNTDNTNTSSDTNKTNTVTVSPTPTLKPTQMASSTTTTVTNTPSPTTKPSSSTGSSTVTTPTPTIDPDNPWLSLTPDENPVVAFSYVTLDYIYGIETTMTGRAEGHTAWLEKSASGYKGLLFYYSMHDEDYNLNYEYVAEKTGDSIEFVMQRYATSLERVTEYYKETERGQKIVSGMSDEEVEEFIIKEAIEDLLSGYSTQLKDTWGSASKMPAGWKEKTEEVWWYDIMGYEDAVAYGIFEELDCITCLYYADGTCKRLSNAKERMWTEQETLDYWMFGTAPDGVSYYDNKAY